MSVQLARHAEPEHEPLLLRELDEERVCLSRDEARFLLEEHRTHISLRPSFDGDDEWLVRPATYCGIIPLPTGRAIYIEPKVGIANLWRMLGWAYDLLKLSGDAPVPLTMADLLESVVEVFVGQVGDLLRSGLLRGYVPERDNLTAMRGRLNVAGHIRANVAAKHRLLCDFDEFTSDVLENRIIRRTLSLLLRVHAWSPRVRLPMDHHERRMAEARLQHIDDRDFDDVHFTRLNERYRTPLALARLLLQMLSVTHRYGDREMRPLLLGMPKVFERFLQRMLAESMTAEGLTVRWEGESRHLDRGRSVSLVPDMVICDGPTPLCIADAKYKETGWDPDDEQAATSVRNADVYQMLAYCVGYGVNDAVLIYAERTSHEIIEIPLDGRLIRVHSLGIDLTREGDDFASECERLSRDLVGVARSTVAVPMP